MLTAQKLEFHDRIARIAAGQGSTRATVFVGQDLTFSYVPRNRRRRAGLAEMVANALHSLSFPLCMALGLASYGLYLYGQWILLGVPNAPESPDLDMAITALATSCITVLLTHVLGLRATGAACSETAGRGVRNAVFPQFRSCLPGLLRSGIFSDLGGKDHLDDRAAFAFVPRGELQLLTAAEAGGRNG